MSGIASVAAFVRPKLVAITAALVVVVGSLAVLRAGPETASATVLLPRAVHLYEGSDVVVLGVRVGSVVEVRPEGDKVRVELEYDRSQPIPADAQAFLVSPTLVADRYIQLAPVYADGPKLPDGATIPLARSAVPVELDEVFASLTDLSRALGPNGANSDGALSELITVAADNLDGNGEAAGSAITEVSRMTQTLAANREQLFGTVRNLQALTTELAERDTAVREFTGRLADVSGQLAGERERLGTALHELAIALADISGFIRDNRAGLSANVANLAEIGAALATAEEDIGKVLDIAPTGIANFSQFWDPTTRSLTGRINGNDKYESPAYFICSLVAQVGVPPEQCPALLAQFADVPLSPPSGAQEAPGPSAPAPAPTPAGPEPSGLARLLLVGMQ
jgi:phospholipid/cholesterol/gamma-HCH transport system substrate-binding protein